MTRIHVLLVTLISLEPLAAQYRTGALLEMPPRQSEVAEAKTKEFEKLAADFLKTYSNTIGEVQIPQAVDRLHKIEQDSFPVTLESMDPEWQKRAARESRALTDVVLQFPNNSALLMSLYFKNLADHAARISQFVEARKQNKDYTKEYIDSDNAFRSRALVINKLLKKNGAEALPTIARAIGGVSTLNTPQVLNDLNIMLRDAAETSKVNSGSSRENAASTGPWPAGHQFEPHGVIRLIEEK